MDRVLQQVGSQKNLDLAWRRILSASNTSYKNYSRHLFAPYALDLKSNLRDMSVRVIRGSYTPSPPLRVYQPKASGLVRPLSILHLEDQILLQAIANVFQTKVHAKRSQLYFKSVYSNLANEKGSDFFIQPWSKGWSRFHEDAVKVFESGYEWVAKFDLSAFYDTVSHALLLSIVYPRASRFAANPTAKESIMGWFSCWCSDLNSSRGGHGLPQGPIASDFLAECLMLQVDQSMQQFKYKRYVDDVLLFGKSERQVRQAILKLEIQCREHGLIPQSAKIAVSKLDSADELRIESISLRDDEAEAGGTIEPSRAKSLLLSSMTEGPEGKNIIDKSKLRFALFRARPSDALRQIALDLLARNPEHVDPIVVHLLKYALTSDIREACKKQILETPYEYIQGQMFHLLSSSAGFEPDKALIKVAISLARSPCSYMLKWGAMRYLLRAEQRTGNQYGNWARYQDPFLVGAVSSELPSRLLREAGVISEFVGRTAFEGSICLSMLPLPREAVQSIRQISRSSSIPHQTHNAFLRTGVLIGIAPTVNPIDELLRSRFLLPKWSKWPRLFGNKYSDACVHLYMASAAFDAARTNWLAYQNTFNNVLYDCLNNLLCTLTLPGYENPIHTSGRQRGRPKDYGYLVGPGRNLEHAHPHIASALFKANKRRNTLPSSHPYDRSTGGAAKHLRVGEQRNISRGLGIAYTEIIALLDSHL